ncbi:RagB/SusD family nutrient uptake outer membrane protein [Marinilongibacter aquaticus]|uniref:RagB/SusD family nutrient uptake outer membrane protein n=1 Tax=Marinilongibacter aquaticus TaxID=2975157 RepID=UPI0021BD8C43|nr:RagB/SusD family nutrient uptake outer membrane protein [Marinilongibacter aquaticus]UBM59346.1 RagB/SusD family nutrient uptake outer membrane protein [Marinilongibacter aquaticus]
MKNTRIYKLLVQGSNPLVIGLLLLISISCVDLKEDPSISRLAPGSYSNQAELELGVTGLYSQLANMASMTTFMVSGWGGDDITTHRVSNKADFREYDQRAVSPLNARSATNWKNIYSTVRAANSVITNSEGLELPDQDVQNRLVGEAYFLRALVYFHLTRIFGEIPLHLTVDPQVDLPKSSQVEVYQQIESDFKMAESLLPTIYPNVQPGAPRPNKGSAKAFLARLYLDWAGFPVKDNSKYALAASTAKEVIDNSASYGFGLVQDLESLWTIGNRFNDESIFTIVYSVANGLSNRKFGKLGHPTDKLGWQETFAEIRYFEDFPDQARKAATYRLDYDWEDFTDQANPVFKKIVGPEGDIPLEDYNSDRNDYLMRYAEVLLIYAEASGRSGNVTPDAWEALNKIRRRAEGLPFGEPNAEVDLTSGDIAELAYTERKWEFAGEYLRWPDLVRMERVKEALSNRNPRVSKNSKGELLEEPNPIIGSLETDNYFAPLPQNEVTLNPNLE